MQIFFNTDMPHYTLRGIFIFYFYVVYTTRGDLFWGQKTE